MGGAAIVGACCFNRFGVRERGGGRCFEADTAAACLGSASVAAVLYVVPASRRVTRRPSIAHLKGSTLREARTGGRPTDLLCTVDTNQLSTSDSLFPRLRRSRADSDVERKRDHKDQN